MSTMKQIFILIFLGMIGISHAQKNEQTYQLSSHILDITSGQPAPNVKVALEKFNEKDNTWNTIDEKTTDENGRIKNFLVEKPQQDNKGIYKLRFNVKEYFLMKKADTFYPFIEVVFQIQDGKHYHVPITLSPFGYSTYRGS